MEIKKKSLVPIYSVAAVWVLYCVFLPLHRTWHFIVLACSAALVYAATSAIFPGKTELIEIPEEPERTGDDKIDALLAEGGSAVAEMRALRGAMQDETVLNKLDEIITVTENIFGNLLTSPDNYNQIKRFAGFYLPTTIKLLHTYDRFGSIEVQGENVAGTRERISAALDTILDSYRKFFDSLFMAQALDIETDIKVLETMFKNEGLLKNDGLGA